MNTAPDQWRTIKPAISDPNGVVAAQHIRAAEAGAELLRMGGNAVDAAIAAAFALAAVEPWMCGLGGSGFMVIWIANEKRAVALDFQGVLPMGLCADDYPIDPELPRTSMGFPAVKGFANTQGATAITVPGAIAGLAHAAVNYGRLGFGSSLSPAIDLAASGIPASWFCSLMIASEAEILAKDPVSSTIYLPRGHPLQPGERLYIPNLERTLRTLQTGGAAEFYHGSLGESLIADLQARGSRMTMTDLAEYKVEEFEPLMAEYRGSTLFTPGEQSGGARLRDFLAYLETEIPICPQQPSPEYWSACARALEASWRAHRLRNGTLSEVGSSTSSLSAADAEGNMVALTYTLLDHFGSGVTLPSTGIIMNNGVSYFDPSPGKRTSMTGGKRINSSNMVPTIAVTGDKARFAVGASGGDLIMPCVAQISALMLDFDMPLEEAMHSPRIDASHRGSIRVDPLLGQSVIDLIGAEYEIELSGNVVMPKLYACPSGVARDADGILVGLNDPVLPDGGASGASNIE